MLQEIIQLDFAFILGSMSHHLTHQQHHHCRHQYQRLQKSHSDGELLDEVCDEIYEPTKFVLDKSVMLNQILEF